MHATSTRRLSRLSAVLALAAALAACGQGPAKAPEGEAHEAAAAEFERGPHRGRLLRDGDFALEITLYEDGPAPLFRLRPRRRGPFRSQQRPPMPRATPGRPMPGAISAGAAPRNAASISARPIASR